MFVRIYFDQSGSRGHVACSATILRLVNQTFQEEETFFFLHLFK